MATIVINEDSGTASSPWRVNFPTGNVANEVYAFVFIGFTRAPISPEYKTALQNTLQGYCNDSARNLQCTTTQFYTNLEKPTTGTGFAQVEVHTGSTLTDEEAAAQ